MDQDNFKEILTRWTKLYGEAPAQNAMDHFRRVLEAEQKEFGYIDIVGCYTATEQMLYAGDFH